MGNLLIEALVYRRNMYNFVVQIAEFDSHQNLNCMHEVQYAVRDFFLIEKLIFLRDL